MSLLKNNKSWKKSTNYEVNHNIINFDLKQKSYLKIEQKDKMRFNEVKNYNPYKHCEWHHDNYGWMDTFIGLCNQSYTLKQYILQLLQILN